MPALLTLRFADRPARRLLLEDGRAHVAGRAADCDLRVDDSRVSRHHARFERLDGAWRVTDLESKNGVRVDGRPVVGAELLPDRCWLSLGGLLGRFEPLGEEGVRKLRERDLERRHTTLELRRRLDPSAGLPALLQQVLDSVLRVSGAERAYVLLRRDDGGLDVTAAGGGPAGEGFPGSAGAVERALVGGCPVVTCDARDDAVLGGRPSVCAEGIRALVCVPLEVPGRALGVVYADSRAPGSAFSELDVELLQAFAAQAALALAVAELSQEAEGLADEIPTRWTAEGSHPAA